ncbi:MAG: hypothetical protein GX561_08445 [Lentisphaerae bacterium]|jgi:hypothetical protein|nr:hypothetical protein [Lentisphaerota bacterium]
MITQCHLPVERLTEGPKHHFFGYFDKFPWDVSGRYLLSQEVDFTARQPEVGEDAVLGMIDLQDGNKFIPIATTKSWCWQQGCMFQWLMDDPNKVIYNDREGDVFVSRILDVKTGKIKTLHRPIYCLSPDGKWALSVNFSRLDRERPGYGYPGGRDPWIDVKAPEDDGIYLVDLKNDTSKLIISVAQITEMFYRSDMENTPGWFNHLLFSPNSKRIAFFHRWRIWKPDGTPGWHVTHMFTANIDGSKIWPLNLENMSSHYTWTAPNKIINYSNRHLTGWQYYLYTDQTHKTEIIAKDVFPGDGHCSYSSDGKWMLTDSYPGKDSCRKLFLYNLESKEAFEIGSFYADPAYPTVTRCDLHPNWSRDDKYVCIDSIHEGSRQVYLLDVSSFTKK